MTSPGGPPSGFSRRAVLFGAAAVGLAAGGVASAGILLGRGQGSRATLSATAKPLPSTTPFTVAEMLGQHPFRVAHRGGSDDWPEMSAYAYRRSAARGYRALEFSAARSSDGVWFGLHDATLDRTSGTSGLIAADLTWAQINAYRITAATTRNPHQPSQPYLPLRDFLTEFTTTNTVFLDPKSVATRFHPELLSQVRTLVRHPSRQVIAKGPGGNTSWARLAREVGLRSWGFYYAADVDSGLLGRTAGEWDLLGMEVGAPDTAWAAALALGKPVIAHVLHNREDDRRARALGAAGEIVADVLAIAP